MNLVVLLKRLVTDNGGEYTSKEFEMFCRDHGIVHTKTPPYTPQNNGVAERYNRTILERLQSLLQQSRVPKHFWAEPAATAVYLINQSPHTALKGKVPENMWSGRVPSLSHLKVFGW